MTTNDETMSLVPVEAIEKLGVEIQQDVDLHRTNVVRKITLESEALVDELLLIIYNHDVAADGHPVVEPRIKLTAIGMLLDRGIPKLAVDHSKSEIVEESGTRKKIREEIEALVRGNGGLKS